MGKGCTPRPVLVPCGLMVQPVAEFQAVIFDLFGTLVAGAADEAYSAYLQDTARAIGADEARLCDAWLTEEMRDLRAGVLLDCDPCLCSRSCLRHRQTGRVWAP